MRLENPPCRPYLGRMRISDVISSRGQHTVVTVTPDTAVTQLLATLAEHRIGAVVVSNDGTDVSGIVSERDVVRAISKLGDSIITGPVSAIMTTQVVSCEPAAQVLDILQLMTERRFRHLPVVDAGGTLLSIISIGDAVKARLSTLEFERDQLMEYIHQ